MTTEFKFLLVAHIGGTKARFGLKELKTPLKEPDNFLYKSRYSIGFFKNSATMIEHFIQEARDALKYRPDKTSDFVKEIIPKNIKVCLALAGPIGNNKCELLNWQLSFDGELLEKKNGI